MCISGRGRRHYLRRARTGRRDGGYDDHSNNMIGNNDNTYMGVCVRIYVYMYRYMYIYIYIYILILIIIIMISHDGGRDDDG